MKTSTYTQKAVLKGLFFTLLLFVASCKETDQSPIESAEIAEMQSEMDYTSHLQERDVQYLMDAAALNLQEIQLGILAQQKGTTAPVKELGKMMEKAHHQSLSDLNSLATTKGIELPTSLTLDSQDVYHGLNEMSLAKFDKVYADKMVRDHEESITAFEVVFADSDDTQIKNWAIASIADLNKHLMHAKNCQRICADK